MCNYIVFSAGEMRYCLAWNITATQNQVLVLVITIRRYNVPSELKRVVHYFNGLDINDYASYQHRASIKINNCTGINKSEGIDVDLVKKIYKLHISAVFSEKVYVKVFESFQHVIKLLNGRENCGPGIVIVTTVNYYIGQEKGFESFRGTSSKERTLREGHNMFQQQDGNGHHNYKLLSLTNLWSWSSEEFKGVVSMGLPASIPYIQRPVLQCLQRMNSL